MRGDVMVWYEADNFQLPHFPHGTLALLDIQVTVDGCNQHLLDRQGRFFLNHSIDKTQCMYSGCLQTGDRLRACAGCVSS